MNTEHQRLCSSREWEEHLHATVLPAVTGGLALGEEMLELGAGPGAATDWLRTRVGRLVVVERDSVHSEELHRVHREDTYNPIEPAILLALLGALGYVRIKIEVDDLLTFVAHKPKVDPDHPRIEE